MNAKEFMLSKGYKYNHHLTPSRLTESTYTLVEKLLRDYGKHIKKELKENKK